MTRTEKTVLALLSGTILLCLLFLLDPQNQDWGGAAVKEIKFLPVIILAVIDVIVLLTFRLRWSFVFNLLFMFSLFMVAGSLYAMLALNSPIEETYLSRGLIASVTLFAGNFVAQSKPAVLGSFISGTVRMLLFYSIGVSILTGSYVFGWWFTDLVQIFQVQSVLLAATMLLIANGRITAYSFILIGLTLLAISKTTSLAMLALAIGISGYFYSVTQLTRITGSQLARWLMITVIIVGMAGIFTMLYQFRLNDRGNDTRESNTAIRVTQVLESPIIGDLFTGSPLVDFGTLHIPSHSEWLDLLASAGALAVLGMILPVLWLILRSGLPRVSRHGYRLKQWLALLLLLYGVVMTVNPLSFSPSLIIPFWLALGILAGLDATKRDYWMKARGLIPTHPEKLR